MRDGVRIVNCARGELIDLDALVEGLESGKVAGAALDVFPEEPFGGHPILERDDVVVTPHLGASTAEAQDRAGVVTAEQVTAALTGGVVTTAVNIAAVRPEVMEALAPFVPLCEKLGAPRAGARRRRCRPGRGRVPRPPRRPGHAPARDRGARRDPSRRTPRKPSTSSTLRIWPSSAGSSCSTLATRPRPTSPSWSSSGCDSGDETAEVAGTGVGPRNIPYLARVWGEDFYLPFAEHLAIFRYTDQPGMIGRVGTIFGEEGVNIVSAAVGAEPDGDTAVMALTTDAPVNQSTIDRILELDGFSVGRAVCPLGSTVHEGGRPDRHGGPEVLQVQERPDPPVGPGEVRIAVKAAGINFADTMARVGLYPDAPKPPCVIGYEVAGEVESVGEGVDRLQGRRPGRRRHPLRRPGRARQRSRGTGPAAGRPAQLRAGRRDPGQLRDRLQRAGDHGRPEGGRAGPDPRRRRRCRDRGDPDRPDARRRDLRHRLGLQARRDPRAGRRPPDRLPNPGLRAGGDADHRRRGGRRRLRRPGPEELPQGLPAAAPGRAPGHVRPRRGLDRGGTEHPEADRERCPDARRRRCHGGRASG